MSRIVLILFVTLLFGCDDDPLDTVSQQSAPVLKEQKKDGESNEAKKEAPVEAAQDNKVIEEKKPEIPTPGKDVEPIGREPRLQGPVATVNGQSVNSHRFYEELDKTAKHGAKIPEARLSRIRENILNRLIEEELIKQSVKSENIKVSDKEIDKAFKEYREKFKSDDQFANYLKHGKHTEESIRDRIRQKKNLEKLIDKKGSMKVSKTEISEFYEKNKVFYKQKEAIHAKHILFMLKPDAEAAEEEEVLNKIKRIEKLLRRGIDFSLLAKENSEGPTAPKGGDLGFFSRGQMVKPFEDVAFALKPGEISKRVRTRFGYHIIQVVERKEEHQKPLKEVQAQIRASLKNKKFFQERRRVLDLLKADAKIENNLGVN